MTRPAAPAPPHTASARLRSAALGEHGVDQRERGGKHERPAQPLDGAGGEQGLRRLREPTDKRGDGVEREAGHEHPPRAEEVGGATTEQQETGGGHRVGADHRLQRLRRVVQLAPDLGQRHDDDVLIERDDQHRERQQRQRRRLAGPAARGCCFGEWHERNSSDGLRSDTYRNVLVDGGETRDLSSAMGSTAPLVMWRLGIDLEAAGR